MRKRTGRAPAAELAQVVVGVRTRSRSAAFASAAAAAAPTPKRPRNKQAAARAEVEVGEAGRGDDGGCAAAAAAGCYLQLRSRSLFMAADVRCPVPMEEKAALLAGEETRSGASLEPVVRVAGFSRCSSTASSVNVIVAAARERSRGAAEVGGRDPYLLEFARSASCSRLLLSSLNYAFSPSFLGLTAGTRGPRRRELRQRLGRVRAREVSSSLRNSASFTRSGWHTHEP